MGPIRIYHRMGKASYVCFGAIAMRKLVLLGGPTGVGKSTAMALLQGQIEKSALVDADDVWRVSGDLAIESNRPVAIGNVVSVVRGYFAAGCETAIVSWVFARPALYTPLIKAFRDDVDAILQIYLVASADILRQRLAARGDDDRFEYSVTRLDLIEALPFARIDTSDLDAAQVADLLEVEIRAL